MPSRGARSNLVLELSSNGSLECLLRVLPPTRRIVFGSQNGHQRPHKRTELWEFRSSLGVAIGRAALARPRTGTSEPFGRGPVSGGLGRIAFTVPMS